ncbi:alpha/beta hydrolase [Paenibacillus glufosinatiresistens]|uniref:alpha/beta hydrolase n=1 Tax=Paenibacillus glufosinatiresistens TaxID=3070657 RepID=UPI00286DC9AE|nr:alpha/beta hydrolase [Paenibacillus sp. YX.27]
MSEQCFWMTDPVGVDIHIYSWLPDAGQPLRGAVQIAHGMCETAGRYAEFAEALNTAGFAVYAGDHRGHGRTAGAVNLLGDAGEDGFYWMRRDLTGIAGIIRERHPELPLFLMGHSMGSFLVQKLMGEDGPELYDGFLLTGSNGPRRLLALGEWMARSQNWLRGDLHRSVLLNTVVFGTYNRSFSPVRTAFDWLSRDPEEVDRYIADPYCGAICTTRFFRDFFRLLRELHTEETLAGLSPDKPVFLFSGDKDPVGLAGKGMIALADLYRSRGIRDVELKLYPGGRHELLHETNRAEVTADVLDWLQRHLPESPCPHNHP